MSYFLPGTIERMTLSAMPLGLQCAPWKWKFVLLNWCGIAMFAASDRGSAGNRWSAGSSASRRASCAASARTARLRSCACRAVGHRYPCRRTGRTASSGARHRPSAAPRVRPGAGPWQPAVARRQARDRDPWRSDRAADAARGAAVPGPAVRAPEPARERPAHGADAVLRLCVTATVQRRVRCRRSADAVSASSYSPDGDPRSHPAL